jgi:hypothetical protein
MIEGDPCPSNRCGPGQPPASLAGVAQQDRSAQAGAYLRMLLARPGDPRSCWLKHAPDAGPAEVDADAVADVLRDHSSDPGLPYGRLVTDALTGRELAPTTMDLFVDAFELSPRHATRLRDLLSGSDSVRVITADALAQLARESGPPRHDTLALHELHTLGPDGLPAEHQTIQVIKSTVDQLEAYPYRFDTDQLVVEVVRGGKVGDTYRVTDSFFGVDIVLDHPLAEGETALMHYRTTFAYRNPPATEFRRGVIGTMYEVTLWVRFHPERLPARVWQGRWDRLDHANVVEEHLVELDDEFSVQARFDAVTDAIVGFHWSWD